MLGFGNFRTARSRPAGDGSGCRHRLIVVLAAAASRLLLARPFAGYSACCSQVLVVALEPVPRKPWRPCICAGRRLKWRWLLPTWRPRRWPRGAPIRGRAAPVPPPERLEAPSQAAARAACQSTLGKRPRIRTGVAKPNLPAASTWSARRVNSVHQAPAKAPSPSTQRGTPRAPNDLPARDPASCPRSPSRVAKLCQFVANPGWQTNQEWISRRASR